MNPEPKSDPASSPAASNRTLRVLIADDHADAAETLAMVMSLEGHAVVVASDGAEALRLADEVRPDVVILDIGMPGLNGHSVVQRLRETRWGGDALVVAVTGFGEAEDKQRAQGSGFDEHFTKPVDPSQLIGRMVAWQRSRPQRSAT